MQVLPGLAELVDEILDSNHPEMSAQVSAQTTI
jgi:hypothetical protein